MRWEGQAVELRDDANLPGLVKISHLLRSVTTPEFAGMVFHEVLAKSALNKVASPSMPFGWTINPYRGCSHACVYCFARPSHRYLDLDAGKDFDQQVVVKSNVAEVLRAEVARTTWAREPVALGTNTDPYQRAEGRYALMPGIIDALAGSGTPFSILTKGTLLRRDLAVLSAVNRSVPVDLAMSIAVFDDELQQSIEPGTPSTQARLQTVRAATDAGLSVAVFMMPVLPFLTDSERDLDRALAAIRAAGARSVSYSALHLRPGVKEWFAQWLHAHRPEMLGRYRALYGEGSYAPRTYRRTLAARIKPLIAKHGLNRAPVDPATGGVRSRVSARDSDGEWRTPEAAPAAMEMAGTLF